MQSSIRVPAPPSRGLRGTLGLISVLGLVASLGACSVEEDPAGGPLDGESLAVAEDAVAVSCVTIRRDGPNIVDVPDAMLVNDAADPSQASANYGAAQLLTAGTVSTSQRRVLLGFLLTSVPPGKVITSATMGFRLNTSLGQGTLRIHEATAPWAESSVTWNSFGSSFKAAPTYTVSMANQPNGSMIQVDITSLVTQWYTGASPNYGMVFDQPVKGRTTIGSSEAPSIPFRPFVTVCYKDPVVCGDGACDPTETCGSCASDCGPCPTCSDNVQNQGETGVDCGGPCGPCGPQCGDGQCTAGESCASCANDCGACPTCSDGVQNQGETGVDCGGPCGPCGPQCGDGQCTAGESCASCPNDCGACPTCSDGVQNQGETGVDCGGPCAACPPVCPPAGSVAQQYCNGSTLILVYSDGSCGYYFGFSSNDPACAVAPTCGDGVQNQGETGVDCGGPCAPCPGAVSCYDGLQNQGETGVDCGGPCPACGGGGCPNGSSYWVESWSCAGTSLVWARTLVGSGVGFYTDYSPNPATCGDGSAVGGGTTFTNTTFTLTFQNAIACGGDGGNQMCLALIPVNTPPYYNSSVPVSGYYRADTMSGQAPNISLGCQ